jgi:hypothetical protein
MCPIRKQKKFPKPAAMPTIRDMRDLSLIKRPIPPAPGLLSRLFLLAARLLAGLGVLILLAPGARAEIFDGGVNSANLGKGEWIYVLGDATNHLADSQTGPCCVLCVTDVPSMIAYFKTNLALQYIAVKAGHGASVYPSRASPQFTTNLVNAAHAQGLKIFGYTRSFGTDLPGELGIATNVFDCGGDGFIFDAEDEWPQNLSSGVAAAAWQLLGAFKTNWPTKFLAHSPYPNIFYHYGSYTKFPYKEFGYWCDAVMPMVYWYKWSQSSSTNVQKYGTPVTGLQWMDSSFSDYHNWLRTIPTNTPPTYKDPAGAPWTKAIKPLVPLGEADTPGVVGQTYSDITNFVGYCKTDPACVTAGGYKGCCFFRVGLQDTGNMLPGIADSAIGDSLPFVTCPPCHQTLPAGASAAFSLCVTGTPPIACQWRRGGTALADATDTVLVLQRVTTNDVGIYDAVLTNWAGATTSAPVRLTLISLSASAPQPPVLQVNGVGDYRVDYQNTLATNNWSFWTNLSLSVVTQREVTDLEAANQQARFYRVLPQ